MIREGNLTDLVKSFDIVLGTAESSLQNEDFVRPKLTCN